MEKWQIAGIFSINTRSKLTLPHPRLTRKATQPLRSLQEPSSKLIGWLHKTARKMADVAALF